MFREILESFMILYPRNAHKLTPRQYQKAMKMKILMISPECAPFSKAGGLGDMVSSISKQFAASGCDVKVFTPLYSTVKRPADIEKQMDNLSVHMGLGLEYKASV